MNKQTEIEKVVRKESLIKIAIDMHRKSYRVVRQVDYSAPQPAQKFEPAKFLTWVKTQLVLAEAVHSCYEAGPFGYVLHRELVKPI